VLSWDQVQFLSRSEIFTRQLVLSNHLLSEAVWRKMIEGDATFVIQQVSAMGLKPPVQLFVPILEPEQTMCVLYIEASFSASRIVLLLPPSALSDSITSVVKSLATLVLSTLAVSEPTVDLKVEFCAPSTPHGGHRDLNVIMTDVFLHHDGNVEKINQLTFSETDVMAVREFNLLRVIQGLEIVGFDHEIESCDLK
jgi:hypothetical protein